MTVTSRLHRQKGKKDKERQKRIRGPVVAPRYESGGEAAAPIGFTNKHLISLSDRDCLTCNTLGSAGFELTRRTRV